MLKIVSLNVWGLISPAKCDSVLYELPHSSFDLILLQETHVCSKIQADTIARKWHGTCYWSFGRGRSAGVCLLVPPKFQGKILRYIFDSDGRIPSVLVLIRSMQFNILNIYAPNTIPDRKALFDQLHTYFLSPVPVVAGNFFVLIIHSIV